MPSPDMLAAFIAKVESNAHAEAIEEFYTPGASMQENDQPPRVGRDTLAAHERKVLARMRSVLSRCMRPVFVNGDYVVIRRGAYLRGCMKPCTARAPILRPMASPTCVELR